jgi:hypothetical protein
MSTRLGTLRQQAPRHDRMLTRGRRIALTVLLGVTALTVTAGTVAAQTAGTAGAAPEVAPVISSPPARVVSPGVLSADPQSSSSGSDLGVRPGGPTGVRSNDPLAPTGAGVLPSGMPNTGDGSLTLPLPETNPET